MAALTTEQLEIAWDLFQRRYRERFPGTPMKWSKATLRLAATSTNTWIDANTASYVAALLTGAPAFGGANSTGAEKGLMFDVINDVRQGRS